MPMTAIVKAEVVDVVQFTDKDKARAAVHDQAIVSLIRGIHEGETTLARRLAELGTHLLEVRKHQYWRLWGKPSFGNYVDGLQESLGKGRTQIYQIISVAEKLLPAGVTPEQLTGMGISKAAALKGALTATGTLPQKVLDFALDPKTTLASLQAFIFEETKVKPNGEPTKYFDLGGCYLTEDERDIFKRAYDVATKIDPVIPNTLPEHIRQKEILLRVFMDFLSAYEAVIIKGE